MGKLFLFLLFLLAYPLTGHGDGIDLHAHLFMKEGMGWFFKGSFNEPLSATNWQARLSSETNATTLDHSGLNVVVAALYAHPLFKRSLRDAIREQIRLARQFVKEHPNWILATRPDDAKTALNSGKSVLILALEGAAGILENENDLKEFIDEGGIRIVNLIHLTDDEYGGAAFLKGYRIFSSPFAFLRSLAQPLRDENGIRINAAGLTDKGKEMAIALIKRKVWIDLAHASDQSQSKLIPLMTQAGQPLLYTHTVLRKYLRAERALSNSQLIEVAKTQGIIGLVPSEEMLAGTPPHGPCRGSLDALAIQYEEISKVLGTISVDIGSDFNGGIPHLKPSCDTGTSLDQEGFWNIGQSTILWQALAKMEAQNQSSAQVLGTLSPRANAVHFIDVWSKVWSGRSNSGGN